MNKLMNVDSAYICAAGVHRRGMTACSLAARWPYGSVVAPKALVGARGTSYMGAVSAAAVSRDNRAAAGRQRIFDFGSAVCAL
jgi:hypothetical protein